MIEPHCLTGATDAARRPFPAAFACRRKRFRGAENGFFGTVMTGGENTDFDRHGCF